MPVLQSKHGACNAVTRVDTARTSMAAMTALEEYRFSVKEEADTV